MKPYEPPNTLDQYVAYWKELPVDVRARFIPRYLWTTASIDVFLHDKLILSIGGQLKFTGGCKAEFQHNEELHNVELSWRASRFFSFPYCLKIDDREIASSKVRPKNWWILLMVFLILGAFIGVKING